MHSTARIIFVVSLALGSLSACGKTQAESGPGFRPPAAGAYEDRPTGPAIDMITKSGDYPERRYAVDRVDMTLTEECMREAGIPWSGVVDKPNPEAKYGGTISLDRIRRHGYGLSDGDIAEPAPATPPADDKRLRLALLGPPDDLERLTITGSATYGYPRRGCAARAHVAVYGDLETWARIFYLPQEVNLDLHQRAIADERYAAAVTRWRECMKQRGHSYESPGDIPATLVQQYRRAPQPLAQRRAAEIALALQDVGCNKQVGLAATGLALRREYASKLDPPLGRELNRLAALFDAAEQRSLTNRPGPGAARSDARE